MTYLCMKFLCYVFYFLIYFVFFLNKLSFVLLFLFSSVNLTFFVGTNPISRQHFDFRKLGEIPIKNFVKLHCGGIGIDSDTTWNELHTASAARMAVGCAIDLAFNGKGIEKIYPFRRQE